MSAGDSTKRCPKCGEAKALSEFGKHRKKKDGIRSHCKACEAEYIRKYRQANKERIAETSRAYQQANKERIKQRRAIYVRQHYAANKERILEKNAQYREANRERVNNRKREYAQENKERIAKSKRKHYEANKEQILEGTRQYRENNKDRIAEYQREWYEANKEEVLAQRREYYEANAERIAEYNRQHYEANKEKYHEYARNRRARQRNAEGEHTFEDVWAMAESQDWLCAFCEEPLFAEYHVDHLQPLSRGGSNFPQNLAVTCPTCNLRKGAKTLMEFLPLLGYSVAASA